LDLNIALDIHSTFLKAWVIAITQSPKYKPFRMKILPFLGVVLNRLEDGKLYTILYSPRDP